MRGMVPLLVVLVGVMVVTTQGDGTGTTPPSVSTKPTTKDPDSKVTVTHPTVDGNNTASAMTSSTFGIVLSVVGVATVRQVL